MSSKWLVMTGAPGGKTVAWLLEKRYLVMAFVHQHDKCSAQVEQQGVEIAVRDLPDFTTYRLAYSDVRID